ncbi:hypothetical protein [Winogradskyella sp. PC-19]|uniref:hypothetical protein n=1 Tax=Winogradskyella sp. PC-19 TaxID=754417 RepID=UPI0026AC40FC|nr:hypothetical protein [Winogradskyella sp. PC-19]
MPKGDAIVLYFEVQNLKKEVENLKQKGIRFSTKIIEQSWLWNEAHLSDLDGNKIIIFHAGKNRKSPPWRIK